MNRSRPNRETASRVARAQQPEETSEQHPELPLTAVVYLRVSTKEQANRGGQIEGFSIPAQRLAAEQKAASMGATLVAEFVDAGESARSINRPQLQRMLQFVEDEPVDIVIVHKVDRLARNRLDDIMITMALEKSGAQLVSCTEHIDRTPAGKFSHGMMALIAEWYSGNLSQEMKTKGLQKVKNGGTMGRAHIGYLNVRKVIQGQEIRTVEVDEVRGPLVQWAFEAYASGEWSLSTLTQALTERGLTTVPGRVYTEKPPSRSVVNRMLRSRYYLGIVTWSGVEYTGSHPSLVDQKLFDRVQEVLDEHAFGEKQRVHSHYLKSSVFCGQCGSRLCITKTTNRHGSEYEYFFCLGNYRRLTDCTQSAIGVDVVEAQIEDKWRHVRFDSVYADSILAAMRDELSGSRAQYQRDEARATRRLVVLNEERRGNCLLFTTPRPFPSTCSRKSRRAFLRRSQPTKRSWPAPGSRSNESSRLWNGA